MQIYTTDDQNIYVPLALPTISFSVPVTNSTITVQQDTSIPINKTTRILLVIYVTDLADGESVSLHFNGSIGIT